MRLPPQTWSTFHAEPMAIIAKLNYRSVSMIAIRPRASSPGERRLAQASISTTPFSVGKPLASCSSGAVDWQGSNDTSFPRKC